MYFQKKLFESSVVTYPRRGATKGIQIIVCSVLVTLYLWELQDLNLQWSLAGAVTS